MANPPPADKLPGEIKYRPPQGKTEDRPLERLHQELINHEQAKNGGDAQGGDTAPGDRQK